MSLALQRRRAREAKAELRSISARSPAISNSRERSNLLLQRSWQLEGVSTRPTPTSNAPKAVRPSGRLSSNQPRSVPSNRQSPKAEERQQRLVERAVAAELREKRGIRSTEGSPRGRTKSRHSTDRIVQNFKDTTERPPVHSQALREATPQQKPQQKAVLLERARSPQSVQTSSPRSGSPRSGSPHRSNSPQHSRSSSPLSSLRSSAPQSQVSSEVLSEIGIVMNSPKHGLSSHQRELRCKRCLASTAHCETCVDWMRGRAK